MVRRSFAVLAVAAGLGGAFGTVPASAHCYVNTGQCYGHCAINTGYCGPGGNCYVNTGVCVTSILGPCQFEPCRVQ